MSCRVFVIEVLRFYSVVAGQNLMSNEHIERDVDDVDVYDVASCSSVAVRRDDEVVWMGGLASIALGAVWWKCGMVMPGGLIVVSDVFSSRGLLCASSAATR